MDIHVVRNINAPLMMKQIGLDQGGRVQRFLVQECDRYMVPYLPHRSGMQIKNRYLLTDGILYGGPYAKFLYYGKVMVGIESGSPWAKKNEVKRATGRDLVFDKTKNPHAGPFWDKRMWAAHKDDILSSTARLVGGSA